MEARENQHPRLRSILVLVIIASLMCYCLGAAVLQVNTLVKQNKTRTQTPSLVSFETLQVTSTVTGFPSPFYITNTPSLTPTITITFTPSLTFTEFVPPTRTETPTPTVTLSPSPAPATETPIPGPATPEVRTFTPEVDLTFPAP